MVHGDDFVIAGGRKELEFMKKKLREWYEVKIRAVLGDRQSDDREITILGRQVRWLEDSVEVEADAKHADIIKEGFGLVRGSNGLSSPCVREDDVGGEDGELTKAEQKEYRGLAARANYLAQDRLDLQFAVKEAC